MRVVRLATLVAVCLGLILGGNWWYLKIAPAATQGRHVPTPTPTSELSSHAPFVDSPLAAHTYPLGIVPNIEYEQISGQFSGACQPSSAVSVPASAPFHPPATDTAFGGPIYLVKTSARPFAARRLESMSILVAPSYDGPYMLRGVGRDVPSDLLFANASGSSFPMLIYGEGTAPTVSDHQLWLIAASAATGSPGHWRRESLGLYFPEPGCYLVQIDGKALQYQLTFAVP